MRTRMILPSVALLAVSLSALSQSAHAQEGELTLKTIMQDPDWMGNSPEAIYWADNSAAVYYRIKQDGSQLRNRWIVDLDGQARMLADDELAGADERGGDWTLDRARKVFERNGDVFVKTIVTGEIIQLTRTGNRETNPFFLADESQVGYRRGDEWFIRDLTSGLESQPFDVRATKDPDDDKDKDDDYVDAQQERLFDTVRKREEREDERKAREKTLRDADPTRAPEPWYLGDELEIEGADLSTSGVAMLVQTSPKSHEDAKPDHMPEWVSAAGYVEDREVRPLVGAEQEPHSVTLLQVAGHKLIKVDLTTLPMLDDDPLADLRAAAEARKKAEQKEEEKENTADATADVPGEGDKSADADMPDEKAKKHKRTVTTLGVQWSDDGSKVAFWARANDNKDRWLCVVNAETGELTVAAHLRDEAWINWSFNDYGWMPDNESLWLLSERTGWSHLYLAPADGSTIRALTDGEWEVREVTRSRDGSRFFVTASREHPGSDDLYVVDTFTGKMTRLSSLSGLNSYQIAPDEQSVVLLHSTPTVRPDLYVQDLAAGAAPSRLTNTSSAAFLGIDWAEPEIVAIPSTNVDRVIYTRVYTPAADARGARADGSRPAVMFVHGAGYLQNAHLGWSSYFREFMFHTLLTRMGFVVIDMDYRASAGYGRDWRTAIYRQMGRPELEDFSDGVEWLVANKNVDPDHIGVYGGSYGGFMTLMALFKEPDLFACGAALRPVTDWAHYNHGYTSNILNTPDLDPEAYERSSPIEFAGGLADPLLICHGMVDDNVFFKDTVRLAQRLIELEKEDWEIAIFPIEPHSFREPSSWLNEYGRILRLFESHLR